MAKAKATKASNLKLTTVLDVELPFMYASKSAEYVFGAEVGDGFVTLTIPKDRFAAQPAVLLVKAVLAG